MAGCVFIIIIPETNSWLLEVLSHLGLSGSFLHPPLQVFQKNSQDHEIVREVDLLAAFDSIHSLPILLLPCTSRLVESGTSGGLCRASIERIERDTLPNTDQGIGVLHAQLTRTTCTTWSNE